MLDKQKQGNFFTRFTVTIFFLTSILFSVIPIGLQPLIGQSPEEQHRLACVRAFNEAFHSASMPHPAAFEAADDNVDRQIAYTEYHAAFKSIQKEYEACKQEYHS